MLLDVPLYHAWIAKDLGTTIRRHRHEATRSITLFIMFQRKPFEALLVFRIVVLKACHVSDGLRLLVRM